MPAEENENAAWPVPLEDEVATLLPVVLWELLATEAVLPVVLEIEPEREPVREPP